LWFNIPIDEIGPGLEERGVHGSSWLGRAETDINRWFPSQKTGTKFRPGKHTETVGWAERGCLGEAVGLEVDSDSQVSESEAGWDGQRWTEADGRVRRAAAERARGAAGKMGAARMEARKGRGQARA
jgi:hypothetical protein